MRNVNTLDFPENISPPVLCKRAAISLVFQVTTFALCSIAANNLNQFFTAHTLFAMSGLSAPFLWLARALLSVLATMPVNFALQLFYSAGCRRRTGCHLFRYNEPILELLIFPILFFASCLLLIEAAVNILRGVKIADMQKQFPGVDPMANWIMSEAERRLPKAIVPTSALLWTYYGSALILCMLAGQTGIAALADCSLAAMTIFASLAGMTIAFSRVTLLKNSAG
jgi:hypothetical protein